MPEVNDLVEVMWLDTQCDPTGNPDEATLAIRMCCGYWVGYRKLKVRNRAVRVLVISATLEYDGSHTQAGWECYPAANVLEVRVAQRVS